MNAVLGPRPRKGGVGLVLFHAPRGGVEGAAWVRRSFFLAFAPCREFTCV